MHLPWQKGGGGCLFSLCWTTTKIKPRKRNLFFFSLFLDAFMLASLLACFMAKETSKETLALAFFLSLTRPANCCWLACPGCLWEKKTETQQRGKDNWHQAACLQERKAYDDGAMAWRLESAYNSVPRWDKHLKRTQQRTTRGEKTGKKKTEGIDVTLQRS